MAERASTVKGSEVKKGQVIMSAHRWYTVKEISAHPGSGWIRDAAVVDSNGHAGPLLVFADDDYPVKPKA
jgi:hypothetical protein